MSFAAPLRHPGTQIPRNTGVASGVVLLHVAALWFLQIGLASRTENIVPVEALATLITPTAPPAPVAAPSTPVAAQPSPTPAPRKLTPPREVARPAPSATDSAALRRQQTAVQDQPMADATAAAAPSSTNHSTTATASEPQAVPPAARTPVIEQPSSDAEYLQNPKPPYPVLSKRLREQGRVVLRVLIGVDGRASRAEIHLSSGYERLDQSALVTVQAWRYVPGKRGGVAEAMWFNVPINFVLE